MNAEVINKFLWATTTVLGEYFSIEISAGGPPQAFAPTTAMEPVTVVLEISGDLSGQFLLGCREDVALRIARAMMSNPDYAACDDLCRSALAELGNMTAGMAATGLSELGIMVELSPPIVITGSAMSVHFSVPVIIGLPLASSAGNFRLYLALQDSAGR